MYYEVAKGEAFSKPRGILVKEDDLYDWVIANGSGQIGMSVFGYRDSDISNMQTEPVSNWFCQAYCTWVPIDIDKGDNSDEDTLHTLQSLIYALQKNFNIKEHSLKIYFSGSGYHVMIHGDCFGFPKDHSDLPYIVKATMENMSKKIGFWDMIDDKVYMRTSIIRCPLSLNPKTGLYKTPLSLMESMTLKPDEIKKLAVKQRLDFDWDVDEFSGDGELSEYVITSIPKLPAYSKMREPVNNYSCIYKLFDQGPVKGSRNNTLLVLASHLRSMGMPSSAAKGMLLDWNNNSLDPKIVHEKVEYVYNKGYKYSCRTQLMKANCSTRCKHYTNQIRMSSNLDPADIINQAKRLDYVKMKKEGIQLGALFGLKDVFQVMAGEIVTLIGVTKTGKSTLMKNILLGINMNSQKDMIPESQLRRTLYYSSEQPAPLFYFQCIQILEGCSEAVANANRDMLYDKWESRYSKIIPVEHLPNKDSLKEDIIKYDPEVIVIDTLEHAVANSYNEHQAMKDLMIAMQQLATTYNKIFYIVSQIGRADSRELFIDLFSGKGSGSIENQSRKVFSIFPSKGDKEIRVVRFLADSYGVLPDDDITLRMTNSKRFKRILL